jgi:hypothetical protein
MREFIGPGEKPSPEPPAPLAAAPGLAGIVADQD